MSKGYKVEYENQNQEEIPHWDVATNVEIDNNNNSIPSTNLQDAIDYLAENTNRVLLSSFEGYEEIATDEVTDHPTLAGCGIDTSLTFKIYRLTNAPVNWANETVVNDINPRFWALANANKLTSASNLPNNLVTIDEKGEPNYTNKYTPYIVGPGTKPTYLNYTNYKIYFPSNSEDETKVIINGVTKPYIEGRVFSDDDIAQIEAAETTTEKTSIIESIYDYRKSQAKTNDLLGTVRMGGHGVLLAQQGSIGDVDCWTKRPTDSILDNVDNETLFLYVASHTYFYEYYLEYTSPSLVSNPDDIPSTDDDALYNEAIDWKNEKLIEVNRQYSDYYDRADRTTEFIQNAINFVQNIPNGTLVFPKDKYFLVRAVNEKEWALRIRKKVNIDLNGSTIQLASNAITEYDMIRYEAEDGGPAVDGSTLVNGTILGDRDTHFIMPGNVRAKPEFNYGILTRGMIKFNNISVGKFAGDGFNIAGYLTSITNITVTTQGRINSSGTIVNDSSTEGWWTTAAQTVSKYCKDSNYGLNAIIISDLDNAAIVVNPLFVITFYDAANSVVSQQTLRWGDSITITDNYIKFRISVKTSTTVKADVPKIQLSAINRSYYPEVKECELFECGRNSICVTIAHKVVIEKCIIRDLGGTSNNTGIDVELYNGSDGDLEIIDTDIFRAKSLRGAAVVLPTAKKVLMKDCTFGFPVNGAYADITIEHCQLQKSLTLAQLNIFNEMHPKRTVRNSVIYGDVDTFGTVFESCVFYGNLAASGENTNRRNVLRNTYKNCAFYGALYPGDYENCNFYNTELILRPYTTKAKNYYSRPNLFKFNSCRFYCKTIKPSYDVYYIMADFTNCHLELLGLSGKVMQGIHIRKFENNLVELNHNNVTVSNSPVAALQFMVSNLTTIKNNTFKASVGGVLTGSVFNFIFDNRVKTTTNAIADEDDFVEYNVKSQITIENNCIIPTGDVTLIHLTLASNNMGNNITITNNATGTLFVKNNVILADSETDVNRCDNTSSTYASMYFEDNDYYNAASVTNAENIDIHITNLNIGPSSEQIGN